MNFSFHNKLLIKTNNKQYEFYNTILESILFQLSNFQPFNEYISVGNGQPNQDSQNSFHLTNLLLTEKLCNKSIQSDISKDNLFAKYEYVISRNLIKSDYITELGLSNNDANPTVFNYFSLISNETPNGINLNDSTELLFEITIYLTINETSGTLLTSGQNPFIEFLLGNGIDNVFVCKGTNYSKNTRISRELSSTSELFLCEKKSAIQNNSLEISFETSLATGEIDEILFVTNNKVFARKNLKEFKPTITNSSTFTAKENYIIKIDDDIKSINSVTNLTNQTTESNYYVSRFANSFGDKISLPFDNLFNSTTSRFLSKCGKNIFFVSNEKVYGFTNIDFQIKQLNTNNVDDSYILKIISFDNFVFVISKIKPYISGYVILNNSLIKQNNCFENFENIDNLEDFLQIDITKCNNGNFIAGIIKKDKTAISIYFNHNTESGFSIINQISNEKEFNYLLAMFKNNFCDGQIIYLKEGATSAECRIVTHHANISETDIYSSLAYHLTKNATNIYCKSRAIISEKNTEPSLVVYYYPQIFEYNFPLLSNEKRNYISNNLNYVIQELSNNEFKTYNIVGYNEPEEFINNISKFSNNKTIIDVEILNDSILLFLDDLEEPVIAVNLNLNKTQIENLSTNNTDYLISSNNYNKLGTENELVNFQFKLKVRL